MATFDEYSNKYKHVQMERRNGILQLTLHTDGKIPQLGRDLPLALSGVASNELVLRAGNDDGSVLRVATHVVETFAQLRVRAFSPVQGFPVRVECELQNSVAPLHLNVLILIAVFIECRHSALPSAFG